MADGSSKLDRASIEKEEESLKEAFLEYINFYEMPAGVEIRDITEQLLNSRFVKEPQKQIIKRYNRRILVFIYPSDGLAIKGVISFVSDPENQPLIVCLRGGYANYFLLNPGNDLMCPDSHATVVSTMYRGGASEGIDEYGGDDVNDVKNLMSFIPSLQEKLGLRLQNQGIFLLGGSRGGMQMFLALARFPELQTLFSKVVSLSGVLDMHEFIATREDMEELFKEKFGYYPENREWIEKRDPLLTVDCIRDDLPILIIQGTEDNRVTLKHGYEMVAKLQAAGKNVTYWEFEGAMHCLSNLPNRFSLIWNWLSD